MTTKQISTLAHFECTLHNYTKGHTTARKVYGAIRSCKHANCSNAIIRQSARNTFRGGKELRR